MCIVLLWRTKKTAGLNEERTRQSTENYRKIFLDAYQVMCPELTSK